MLMNNGLVNIKNIFILFIQKVMKHMRIHWLIRKIIKHFLDLKYFN
jgi:hypothetical protein